MQKSTYKTKQQDFLFSYLKEMKGKHFTAEEVREHFESKSIQIGIATIYRQLESLWQTGHFKNILLMNIQLHALNIRVKTVVQKHRTFILNAKNAETFFILNVMTWKD